ncbi:hypothetical protein ABTK32_19495, partial [Acinetobacter baumannii]
AVARRLARTREAADVRRVADHPELGRAPKFVLGGGSNLVLTRDLDLGWVEYAAGTAGGQRRTYRGLRNGRPVIELAICWTM